VFCQLAKLRRCLSPRIRRALDELPETLDETYERTLLDIDEENWAYAHRLFQCIVVARRPLHVEELAEFLAFKSEAGGSLTFEGNWRPENARDTVLSTCSSLIAIVDVEGSPVIQFSHFSVKEYLTSNRTAEGRVSRYYIPLEPAHLFVTQASLSLLLQLDKHVTKKIIEDLPLARYAGRYWTDHAKFGNVPSLTEDLIKRFFNPENHHFANWVWIYDTISHKSMNTESPSRPTSAPLHYAAFYGYYRVAEWLITTCSQHINDGSGYDSSTPLHFASRQGRFTVVQLLLTHRADVNARDMDCWTPLHHASLNGCSKVVRLLLEHGADVDSESNYGETPLFFLFECSGNLEAAQVLLGYGANPNTRSTFGENPLYMALKSGSQALTQLLLKYGADPFARDVHGRTLLHLSYERGDLKVAQGLLELGVDVNSRDNQGRTPLQVASRNRREKVTELLLQHGGE
jgi:ankyrin repeat protein